MIPCLVILSVLLTAAITGLVQMTRMLLSEKEARRQDLVTLTLGPAYQEPHQTTLQQPKTETPKSRSDAIFEELQNLPPNILEAHRREYLEDQPRWETFDPRAPVIDPGIQPKMVFEEPSSPKS